MSWKSGCLWLFVAYLSFSAVLSSFGVEPAVVRVGFLITVLFVCLYLYWRRRHEPDSSASKHTTTRQSVASTVQTALPVSGRTAGTRQRQSPRPHIRRAHLHTYWQGPRGDPKKRIKSVRWMPPITVGDYLPKRGRKSQSERNHHATSASSGNHHRQSSRSRRHTGRSQYCQCPENYKENFGDHTPIVQYCPRCGKLGCRGHGVPLRHVYCPNCGRLKL